MLHFKGITLANIIQKDLKWKFEPLDINAQNKVTEVDFF